jgi:hypothetical protein
MSVYDELEAEADAALLDEAAAEVEAAMTDLPVGNVLPVGDVQIVDEAPADVEPVAEAVEQPGISGDETPAD